MERLFYRNKKTGEINEYLTREEFAKFGSSELVRMTASEVQAHLSLPIMGREEVERARLAAYADPITGSDRFQIEAAAERLIGHEQAAVEAERKWLERRAEIAAEFPWPEVD